MIFLIIIIAISLIVALIGLIYYFYRNNQDIADLSRQLDQLSNDSLSALFDQVKNSKLAGSTLDSFQAEQDQYTNIVTQKLPTAQNALLQAADSNSNFRVWSAYRTLVQLTTEIQTLQTNYAQIDKHLTQLIQQLQTAQEQSAKIQAQYQDLQNKLTTQSDLSAAAQKNLQERLQDKEQTLTSIKQLAQTGDVLEATEQLSQLKTQLDGFQSLLEQVITRQQRLQVEFKAELTELKQASQRLKDEGINIADPQILPELDQIQSAIEQLQTALNQLEITEFDKLEQKVKKRFEVLYNRIAVEWRSKRKVKKQQRPLVDFIHHALKQNASLLQELDRLNQDFLIDIQNRRDVQAYQEHILQIEREYHQQIDNIRSSNAVYSQVLQAFQLFTQQLSQIEQQQQALAVKLQKITTDFQQAQKNLQSCTQELYGIQKQVKMQHLKGLPASYNQTCQMVTEEINQTLQMLQNPPIDVEELTKQCFVTQEDFDNFVQKTNSLLADVSLISHLLQYANRYKADYPQVAQAIQTAQGLCDQAFDYHQAVKTLGAALEQVEPGCVQRLQNLAQAEQNNSK